MNRHGEMTEKVVALDNLNRSFDYVLRGERKNSRYGKYLIEHRTEILEEIRRDILDSTFQLNHYFESEQKERGKTRRIQSVPLKARILLHAVMEVVEAELTPTLIVDTAASIKGRGMHWLHKRIYRDMMQHPDETAITYKSDYQKCYESIDQDDLIRVIRRYIKDKRILYILETAIRMLPTGVSIGLRTSQFLVNLYLSHYVDHPVKRKGAKHYRRYCDDELLQTATAYEATGHIRLLQQASENAKMKIKPNFQFFRTETRPVDALGFETYSNGQIKLRKATKQRFARKWKRIKSKRRKIELIGSFYGIAKHAHAKHLFKKITGITMKQFSELGLKYVRDDGQEFYNVQRLQLSELTGCKIVIKAFVLNAPTKYGLKTVVVFDDERGDEKKFITGSDEMTKLLIQAKKKGLLPFETTISRTRLDDGKCKFSFN